MRRIKRALKYLTSNWRFLFTVSLLLICLYEYLEIQHKNSIIISKDKERNKVLETVQSLSSHFQKENAGIPLHKRDISLLELESAGILVGGGRDTIKQREADVCPEEYRGNQDWPYQFHSWVTVPCKFGKKVDDLVTVFLSDSTSLPKTSQGFRDKYPNIRILSDCTSNLKTGSSIDCLGLNPSINYIKKNTKTKYLLYGADLEFANEWVNLERAVRVMSDSELTVFAVGGSSRNLTGHWATGCQQIQLDYYRLQILSGYKLEYKDCMVCDYTGGAVLLRTSDIDPPEEMDPDTYLLDAAIRKAGLWLVCPDIMYFTRSKIGQLSLENEKLKRIAKLHNFQGVVTERKYHYDYEYSCDDIDMTCDIRSQAAEIIVPWCCVKNFKYILNALEYVRGRYKTHYEIESGTLLGAVKLGNFIPWDIDIDLAFRREDFDLFRTGGPAAEYLKAAGIQLYHYSEDMYHVKGAGMFFMWYKGIMAEMLGDLKNCSLSYLPNHLSAEPTIVQVGPELWVPTITNPGLYIRGRYGPGYLYHVQSWRHAGMGGSYDKYSPVAWQPCSQANNQACLTNYPIIGNLELRPNMFP